MRCWYPATRLPRQAPRRPSRFGAADIDAKRLVANSDPGSWLNTGNGYQEQRFSKLDQINDTNVSNLGLAWYADMDTERGQESTPIVVDGVMYLTTAWSLVKALRHQDGYAALGL